MPFIIKKIIQMRRKKKAFLIFFTSACRRRLFRKLYSGLYSSTDNRRSGKAGLQSVSLSLFYWPPVRGNFFCHLLSFCCLVSVSPAVILSLFSLFFSLGSLSHMFIRTPVQNLWTFLVSLLSPVLPAVFSSSVSATLIQARQTNTRTHTYIDTHSFTSCLGLSRHPALSKL